MMKVIWQGYDLPSFEFDTEERAIVIGADYAGEEREYIDYWVHPGYGCEMSDELVAVKL